MQEADDSRSHPRQPTVQLRSICVYCGSSDGSDPQFLAAAQTLGAQMARADIGLVYGGGGCGLMGATARAVLAHGGRVTGIIPEFLTDHDAVLADAQHLTIVPDMHTRKRLMFDQADALVALPGGIGTLEELVEQMTWIQLGRHVKPVLIANIGGFWRPLLDLLDHMRGRGFIPPALEVRPLIAERVEDILPMLQATLAQAATAHAGVRA